MTETAPPRYDARLGVFSGTMMVIGGVIGAGIFLSPAVVAARLGTSALTLSAWALGAIIALIGAFVYAELAARIPKAGGTYVYLRDAFGSLPAFMYVWALFLMVGSGAIAAVAMTGASYAAALFGLPSSSIQPIAATIVVGLTLLNVVGVQIGATAGNVLTILKLGAIGALVLAALFLTPTNPFQIPATAVPPVIPSGGFATVLAMGAALVPVLFAFGGWQQANAVAEELRDPARTLPRALVLGVIGIVATYLLVNVAYLRALGVDGLAASTAPAGDAMAVYLGRPGRLAISAGIVISTLGFNCLVILMSARVYQAMAADGLFFSKLAELHPRWRTPVFALCAQAVVVLALLFTGKYGQLLDYVVFADWIFFGATAATIFVLRNRDRVRGAASPTFLIPLHPFSTLLFIAAALYVVVGSIASNPGNALRGVLMFALGLPAYAYWRSQRTAPSH
ncbi:MAG: amino acid permease [Phycisphaerae bacterium]|nr:amino acid permease [Gemmatimonadaceae bacterium]